ncbi:GatB/YqeY domain-containing protein [Catenovulum sp. SM1970]|uniref:GatB/YqeY domain-containing protein n=1 Tax=Marinifaba aquimaris TaxID=2741323 RepID=UPI001574E047|nr:GatB/YqeY domain-containing protein [Marinifaba aquimaris]NTS78149.1 GatB/YqeY domain-containing protein [Marinifaba aquimaris]
MSLLDQLKDAQKDAMRAKEKVRLGTIRMALAAIKQIEIDEKKTLNDDEIISVLTKMVKQRKDSFNQYTDAGREELAQVEADEIAVIESFLPAQLDEAELANLVKDAVAQSGAAGMQDMGKVMAVLKPQVQGRADMGVVSQQVKAALTA